MGNLGIDPFPEDWELVALFESEPTLTDPEVPWVYNRLRFSLSRPNGVLDCAIEPSGRVLELHWSQDGEILVSLSLRRVSGLEAHIAPQRDYFVVAFTDEAIEPLQVQTKPTIAILGGVHDGA